MKKRKLEFEFDFTPLETWALVFGLSIGSLGKFYDRTEREISVAVLCFIFHFTFIKYNKKVIK